MTSRENNYLIVENIKVKLGKNAVLNSFNMGIKHQEIVSLLGPSGCGKTTLLKTIAGFLPVQSGKIVLKGKVLQDQRNSMPPFKRKMSMVFQDYALFPHLNIENNINFSRKVFSSNGSKSRLFEDLVIGLDLRKLLKKFPNEISGGQQQRVAIARAILSKPKFLLMDEPFANQDVELKEKVMETVHAILMKEEITCLMATHDQSVALKFSDKIGVMREEKIDQLDTPFNVFHQPTTYFSANFIGEGFFLKGKIENDVLVTPLGKFKKYKLISDDSLRAEKSLKKDEVLFLLRANEIQIDNSSSIRALILGKYFKGDSFVYRLKLQGDVLIMSSTPYQNEFFLKEEVGVQLNFNKRIVCFH